MDIIGFGGKPQMEISMYHGSYMEIKEPEIITPKFTKDFGPGFYLTNNEQQAVRFVKKFSRKVINRYSFNKDKLKGLNIKVFNGMTEEWLDFIAECRSEDTEGHTYDIVEGPMADDQIWNHTNAFFEGIISREEFWRRARFSYPTHQICLNTYEALKSIKFIESYEV